jgi:hypothetical protein
MKLERVDLEKEPFSSCALVVDKDLSSKEGQMVAIVIYSPGGNVVVFFKEGYDELEVLVAGEKFLGEAWRAERYKVFDAKPR